MMLRIELDNDVIKMIQRKIECNVFFAFDLLPFQTGLD